MVCTTRPGNGLLYKDFSQVKFFEPASYADRFNWVSRTPSQADFPVQDMSRKPAEYIPFGTASKKNHFDFLIHARNRKRCRPGDNWNLQNWSQVLDNLEGRVGSIGKRDQASHIPGTEDLRGIPLTETANILASSQMVIGCSSGAMHLATLCRCPQVVWSGVPRTMKRFEEVWNPFKVKVSPIRKNHPSPGEVLDAIDFLK